MKFTYESWQKSNTEVSESITTYASVLSQNAAKQTETTGAVIKLKNDIEALNNTAVNEKKAIHDAKIKEIKMFNVVMFDLPESKKSSAKKAYKDDFIKVMNIIDPDQNLKDGDVTDLYRIGNKEASSTRPLIIRFNSSKLRNDILKLRDLVYTNKKNKTTKIFIAPDRTREEREERKKLVDEMRRRKANNEDVVIRNGKVIPRQPFRYKPREFWGFRS